MYYFEAGEDAANFREVLFFEKKVDAERVRKDLLTEKKVDGSPEWPYLTKVNKVFDGMSYQIPIPKATAPIINPSDSGLGKEVQSPADEARRR